MDYFISQDYVVITIFLCYRAQTGPGYDEWTAVRINDADKLPEVPYLDLVQSHFLVISKFMWMAHSLFGLPYI